MAERGQEQGQEQEQEQMLQEQEQVLVLQGKGQTQGPGREADQEVAKILAEPILADLVEQTGSEQVLWGAGQSPWEVQGAHQLSWEERREEHRPKACSRYQYRSCEDWKPERSCRRER